MIPNSPKPGEDRPCVNPDTNTEGVFPSAILDDGPTEGVNSFLASILMTAHDGPEAAALIEKTYPHIRLLADARSYGGGGAEVCRTVKSMLNLTRFIGGDEASLGGANASALQEGFRILKGLIFKGLLELGSSDEDDSVASLTRGYERLMSILSVHDLLKSEAIGRIIETNYGATDHDMALPLLLQTNFNALENLIDPALLASLRRSTSDPVVHDFFTKPRAIGAFNAGRHLQGEAPLALFLGAVNEVTPAGIAEFIADWSAVNGDKDPFGPVLLANIPPAINGTAKALDTLLKAVASSDNLNEVWQRFSYPAETLEKLGLSLDSDVERAITRVAFMGREHQRPEVTAAVGGVHLLRQAFNNLPRGIQEQLVAELNAPDLDLGFTPHTIADLRSLFPDNAEQMYETYLLALHRVIEQVREQRLDLAVITANWANKAEGFRLVDAISPSARTAQDAVAEVEIQVKVDTQKVVTVNFIKRKDSASIDSLREADLGAIQGEVFLVGGIGGGGDVFQAESAAILLERNEKTVPAVFSVRRGDLARVQEQLSGAEVIDAAHGIVRIHPDTMGAMGSTGRLPEVGVARGNPSRPVYLILDNDNGVTLAEKIDVLAKRICTETGRRIDSILGVDTGGDSLTRVSGYPENASAATPDQDQASLRAEDRLSEKYFTYSCVFAPGIDAPDDFPEVLSEAGAEVYRIQGDEREAIHAFLLSSGLGQDPRVFSKTGLVVKALLDSAGEKPKGYTYIEEIPIEKRLDRRNPWKSWVCLTPSMASMVLMKTGDHLKAIGVV